MGQLAPDVVTATSNEFILPVIRSPRNHSQKPLGPKKTVWCEPVTLDSTNFCVRCYASPRLAELQTFCRLSEIHRSNTHEISGRILKKFAAFNRDWRPGSPALCSCRKP